MCGLVCSSLTSPTELERAWTIFSCAVATTLCPLISIILWPTRTPPRSAMPPRIRLHIWRVKQIPGNVSLFFFSLYLSFSMEQKNRNTKWCHPKKSNTAHTCDRVWINRLILTMPFWTLNPSWYFRSGLLIRTVVTGGQLTMFIFTCTWFFKPFNTVKRQPQI